MKKLIYKTYIQTIKNSLGSKLFQNLYIKNQDGDEIDILHAGTLSCAYFVSSILYMFNMINALHATVMNTEKEFESEKWSTIDIQHIKPGDVIIWEEITYDDGSVHKHIGFYIGNYQAISHSTFEQVPVQHHYTFNDTRKIINIYRYNQ